MIRRQDDDLLVWPRTAAFKLLAGTSAAVDWIAGLTTAIGDRRTQPPGHTPTGT